MSTDIDTMMAEYHKESATLKKVQRALELQKTAVSKKVQAIVEKHGKGPYTVDGRKCVISKKGDTYFFLPSRGSGKEEEAPAAAE